MTPCFSYFGHMAQLLTGLWVHDLFVWVRRRLASIFDRIPRAEARNSLSYEAFNVLLAKLKSGMGPWPVQSTPVSTFPLQSSSESTPSLFRPKSQTQSSGLIFGGSAFTHCRSQLDFSHLGVAKAPLPKANELLATTFRRLGPKGSGCK